MRLAHALALATGIFCCAAASVKTTLIYITVILQAAQCIITAQYPSVCITSCTVELRRLLCNKTNLHTHMYTLIRTRICIHARIFRFCTLLFLKMRNIHTKSYTYTHRHTQTHLYTCLYIPLLHHNSVKNSKLANDKTQDMIMIAFVTLNSSKSP